METTRLDAGRSTPDCALISYSRHMPPAYSVPFERRPHCGNPTCRCKRTDNPLKHGPYYQISYTRKGRSKTEFVKSEDVKEVRLQLKNYQLFKKLIDEWVELSLDIARLGRHK